jgi:hypothetical protein
MSWWDHLTQAHATVIGGAFVLAAAIVAFGTGFLERKRQQRNFHYGEVKRAYADSLAYAVAAGVIHHVPPSERLEVVRRLESTSHEVAAQLFLTVPFESASVVDGYTRRTSRNSQQKIGVPQDRLTPLIEEDDDFDTTVQHIRRQLARNLLPLNKHRRDLRKRIPSAAKPPRQLLKCGPLVIRWDRP